MTQDPRHPSYSRHPTDMLGDGEILLGKLRMANCQRCGGPLASASTRSVAHWIDRSKVPMEPWGERLRGRIISVCPACDAYALGSDHQSGCPFFSKTATAFATVHDHDW